MGWVFVCMKLSGWTVVKFVDGRMEQVVLVGLNVDDRLLGRNLGNGVGESVQAAN